ncbi:MAG: rRNA maturation RNase YbeY [Eubacteriales bacterium]
MELYVDNRSGFKIEEELIRKLEECVQLCLLVENFPGNSSNEVSMSLVDNEEIHQLNLRYRHKDCPTDVLSFPMLVSGEAFPDTPVILFGDIIISIEKAMEQAKEYGHPFRRELCYLAIHGMFHLLGYDHIKDKDKEIMRQKEKEVIQRIQLD